MLERDAPSDNSPPYAQLIPSRDRLTVATAFQSSIHPYSKSHFPMNLKKMMQQATKMQEQMAQAQSELADRQVTATVGGGKVTVVANGAGDVISIKISKDVIDPEDVEILEDLVLTGVKKAIEEGKALAQSEMSKLTAGMGLPPGLGF